MLNTMFEVPSRDDVSKVIITEEMVNNNGKAIYQDKEGKLVS